MALPVSASTLFGLGMLAVGALVLLVSARYVWRTLRIVRSPSVASLASVSDGEMVKVEGTAQATEGEGVIGPFSGREAIALRAAVEERRPSVVLYPWYVTLWEAERGEAHRVRTEETEVSVEPAVRTVVMSVDHSTPVPVGGEPPERIEDFVSKTDGIPKWTFWSNPPGFLRPLWSPVSMGKRRYVEGALTQGDEVTVMGRATADESLDPIVVSDRGTRATLWRMARTSLAGLSIGVVGVVMGLLLIVI